MASHGARLAGTASAQIALPGKINLSTDHLSYCIKQCNELDDPVLFLFLHCLTPSIPMFKLRSNKKYDKNNGLTKLE